MATLHLAYLLDKGFDISPIQNHNNEIGLIISKGEPSNPWNENRNTFNWSEVCDYIIPFMSILEEDYKYHSLVIHSQHAGHRTFPFNSDRCKRLLDGRFPITKHEDPKREEDIYEITIENVRKI